MTFRSAMHRLVPLAMVVAGGLTSVSVPAVAGLFGPGKFSIEHVDDRFSVNPTTMVVGRNNRVTNKSAVGGINIDAQGIYLNPFVIRSRADDAVVSAGFVLENRSELDTGYGAPDSLGTPLYVTLLVNGSVLIAAKVVSGENDTSDVIAYNSITHSASSAVNENGLFYLTMKDFAAVVGAQSIAVRVEGSMRQRTIEERDVSKSFLANIRTFYQSEIALKR